LEKIIETQVLVIGGGVTGTGIARDLCLRGFDVVLIEKKDLNAGASGGNHGLLHSGARYIASDPEAAVECNSEIRILKKMAGHCIQRTGGLFVAVRGDDENYIADFPGLCDRAGIPFEAVSVRDAIKLEPVLSANLIAAYQVNDASINPFKISIENMNDAVSRGARYLSFCKLESFDMEKKKIVRANVRNQVNGKAFQIQAQTYINASGAWAGYIAQMADISIPMVFSKGTLLVTSRRLARHVINRLRKATDADILVPGGVVSILGTTSLRVDHPDNIHPTVDEVDYIIDQGAQMIPMLATCRYVRAYSGVRPLVSAGGDDDRNVSRGYTLMDHERDGVDNFITITGGKLTTFRLMAEKTCDRVCEKLGVDAACQTEVIPLPATRSGEWSEPGIPHGGFKEFKASGDAILCECEMVPASAIDSIINSICKDKGTPDLSSIAVRSRVGKGPCQGAFCSVRILSHMYQTGQMSDTSGIQELKKFLNERWKGEHALLWDQAIVQSSIKEMIHCGVFGLELEK